MAKKHMRAVERFQEINTMPLKLEITTDQSSDS